MRPGPRGAVTRRGDESSTGGRAVHRSSGGPPQVASRPQGSSADRHRAGRAGRRRRPEEHRERHHRHRRRQRRRLTPPRQSRTTARSPTSGWPPPPAATTPARQEFVDAGTFWVDVECWNGLSGNVSAQHQQGRPGDRPRCADHAQLGVRERPPQHAADQGVRGRAQPGPGHGRSSSGTSPAGSTEAADATASGPPSPEPGDGVEEFPSSPEELLRRPGLRGGRRGVGRGEPRRPLRGARARLVARAGRIGGENARGGAAIRRPRPRSRDDGRLRSPVAQYIYTMVRARKAHGDKVILDNVTLSFLPGAKIGVVGPNGAGKSTVLQIMAGMQQPSNGEAIARAGCVGRHPAAGAAAQREPRRARQRRGGRQAAPRRADPLRGGQRGDGGARRRLRRAPRRAGRAHGGHREPRRLGARRPHRAGHGRPALPARRRRRHRPLRW